MKRRSKPSTLQRNLLRIRPRQSMIEAQFGDLPRESIFRIKMTLKCLPEATLFTTAALRPPRRRTVAEASGYPSHLLIGTRIALFTRLGFLARWGCAIFV